MLIKENARETTPVEFNRREKKICSDSRWEVKYLGMSLGRSSSLFFRLIASFESSIQPQNGASSLFFSLSACPQEAPQETPPC